jgi:DNA-binding NarL/FixJ family response regulator
MASVLLLQNDPVVGECLRKSIETETGLQVTGVATSLAQARRHLAQSGIDLLVADLRIGSERLVELLRERRQQDLEGHLQVLVIAMFAEDPNLMQALRQGAHGYFINGCPVKSMAGVMRQVLAGESQMSPPIARRMQAHFKQPDRSGREAGGPGLPAPTLTDSERQMLDRVSQGYVFQEIARELQTSEHGVGLRTRSLYRKMQLQLKTTAALKQAA